MRSSVRAERHAHTRLVRVRFRRTSACVRRAKGRVDRRVRRRRARDMRRLAQRRKVSAMPHLCARAWAHAPGTRAGHTRTAQHAHSHYAASSPATAALHARLPLPVLLPEHTRLSSDPSGPQGNPPTHSGYSSTSARCASRSCRDTMLSSERPESGMPASHATHTHTRAVHEHALSRTQARTHARSHICAGTGLTPATSALGLGSPLPHLHREWAVTCVAAPCAAVGGPTSTDARRWPPLRLRTARRHRPPLLALYAACCCGRGRSWCVGVWQPLRRRWARDRRRLRRARLRARLGLGERKRQRRCRWIASGGGGAARTAGGMVEV
jgi:hypothetical protein